MTGKRDVPGLEKERRSFTCSRLKRIALQPRNPTEQENRAQSYLSFSPQRSLKDLGTAHFKAEGSL